MASVRITKTMAEEAAKRIVTAEFEERIEQAKKKRDEYIDALVKQVCPNPIIQVTKEYHSYIYCNKLIAIRSPGGRIDKYGIKFNVPYYTVIDVSSEAYAKAIKLQRDVEMEYERRKEAQDRWKEIILGLGTLKRMQEELPEAVEYVSWPTVKALPSVQYDDWRMALRKIKAKEK